VNIAKTKILAQPLPQSALPDFFISVAGKDIERVEHFPYLGSILSVQCTSAKYVENRLKAAHTAFGRLTSRVFLNKDLNYTTKLMVSTLLCGCETWTLYRRDLMTLEQFQETNSVSCSKSTGRITPPTMPSLKGAGPGTSKPSSLDTDSDGQAMS